LSRAAPMAPFLQCALSAGLIVGAASLQQEGALGPKSKFWNMFGSLPANAPEWCKSEANLTWEEKKQRVAQHATLMWAKQSVKELHEINGTVPKWMDDMVAKEAKQGQMKWAVKEAKRLKAENKEVPEWMAALVEEDNKWANRWASCKVAELEFTGEEAPLWMKENGRKGVFTAATEKLAEIQEQLDELNALKEKEVALVQAKGDIKLAERHLMLAHRGPSALTPQAPRKGKKSLDSLKAASADSPKVLNLAKKNSLSKSSAQQLPEVKKISPREVYSLAKSSAQQLPEIKKSGPREV